MVSVASLMAADTSYDVGNIADIDNDDYNEDESDAKDQRVATDGESRCTISELSTHIEEAFIHNGIARCNCFLLIFVVLQKLLAQRSALFSRISRSFASSFSVFYQFLDLVSLANVC